MPFLAWCTLLGSLAGAALAWQAESQIWLGFYWGGCFATAWGACGRVFSADFRDLPDKDKLGGVVAAAVLLVCLALFGFGEENTWEGDAFSWIPGYGGIIAGLLVGAVTGRRTPAELGVFIGGTFGLFFAWFLAGVMTRVGVAAQLEIMSPVAGAATAVLMAAIYRWSGFFRKGSRRVDLWRLAPLWPVLGAALGYLAGLAIESNYGQPSYFLADMLEANYTPAVLAAGACGWVGGIVGAGCGLAMGWSLKADSE